MTTSSNVRRWVAAFGMFWWLVACGLSPAGAAEKSMARFAAAQPVLNPMQFFTGRTSSLGVIENRRGEPVQMVRTSTSGRIVGGELRMEQTLWIGQKPPQRRTWKVRQIDRHHFEATANDMVGTARGEAWGNTFRWSFELATKPGNPLANVRMTQHMYLQPGGQTLVNRSTLQALGIHIGSVTEQFQRLR